jgi:hypothetical protein
MMPSFITRMFAKAAAPAPKKGGGSSLLPPVVTPPAPAPGGIAFPGWRKLIDPTTARLPQTRFDITNVDLSQTYRNGATTGDTVRAFSRFSPELAASIAANNRVGIPEKYIVIGRNPDGSFNREATQLAMQILRQMGTMPDYQNGFSHVASLRSVSESLAKEIQQEGAAAIELVLDESRLPQQFQPVPISSIVFFEDGTSKGLVPNQKVGGTFIPLDVPTFFYVSLDADLHDVYAQSPLESAIQPVLASTTFLADMRQLCARHIYQRYDIKIDEVKLRERIPQDILNDNEKLSIYLNGVIAEVDSAINNLGLADALVHYDFFEVKYIEGSAGDTPATFETVRNIYDGKIATASKTPPSILGMGSTTQNVASTETLMFMINANGMIRVKLQELYSKAMTLAVRLFGMDVTIEFEFDEIELRPKSELEAYLAMRQSRLLTQLSFGLITDDEVCLRLTGQLTPAGYKPLMGTGFSVTPGAVTGAVTPATDNGSSLSQTGNMGTGKQAPQGAKGSTKK